MAVKINYTKLLQTLLAGLLKKLKKMAVGIKMYFKEHSLHKASFILNYRNLT